MRTALAGDHTMAPPGRHASTLDLVGLVLWAVWVLWTATAAFAAGLDAMPAVAGQAAIGAAFIGARLMTQIRRWLVPAVAVVATFAMTGLYLESVFDPAPRSGPFGFSSITGAFYAQAAIAGLMLTVSSPMSVRPLGALAAFTFALVPIATHTRSAALLLLTLASVAIVVRTSRERLLAVRFYRFLIGGAILGSLAIGAAYAGPGDTSPWTRAAADVISERRIALWHDAAVMMAEHPLVGVGPGRFGMLSPVARSDQDEPWAHNEFLQHGAEMGIPGLLVLSAVFVWGLSRVIARGALDAMAILGAAGLTILGVHACIEYVLQRPAVPILAAALLGAATGPREERR